MTDLRTLNKQRLLAHLDTEIVTLLELARVALDSWPIRMQLEIKTKMTEARLEGLVSLIDAAIVVSSATASLPRTHAVDDLDAGPTRADLA